MNFKEFLMLESPNEYQKFDNGGSPELLKAKKQLAMAIKDNERTGSGDGVVAELKRKVAKLEARGGKADTLNGKRTTR